MITKVDVWYVSSPWRMYPAAWGELHYGYSGMNGVHRWVNLYYRFDDETAEESEERWHYFIESLGDADWSMANPVAPRSIMVMGLHLEEAEHPEEAARERRHLNEVLKKCEEDEGDWRIAIQAPLHAPRDLIHEIIDEYLTLEGVADHVTVRTDGSQAIKNVLQDVSEAADPGLEYPGIPDRSSLETEIEAVCSRLDEWGAVQTKPSEHATVRRVRSLLASTDVDSAAALRRRLAVGLLLADAYVPYYGTDDDE